MRHGLPVFLVVVAIAPAMDAIAPALVAQSKPASERALAFDVVSIKPNKSGEGRRSIGGSGAGWRMVNVSAAGLILTAYPGRTDELLGAPAWVTSERWDVDARATFEPSRDQERIMLRTLLADRFKLAAHVETQQRPIYNLVVARADGRLGPRLRRIEIDCETFKRPAVARDAPPPPANEPPPCSFRMSAGSTVMMTSGGRTLQSLADVLSPMAGRPVFDRTGLTGYYAFTLEHAGLGTDDASLFTALQEQLGLKLEAGRASIEVLVVDRVERPALD